ncbi:MAG: amidinotransferase [Polyangiaceae bacterium]|nr:amidinotransferase [Polyangiaceae bacterium]
MSPPSRGWALRGRANFRSQHAAEVDARAARREWLTFAEAIESLGGTVVALMPPTDALTGMPYAAECGHVVTAGGTTRFLLPNMAAEHRRAERVHWEQLAEKMKLSPTDIGSGTWEAQGDVALFGGVTLLFYGGRTDHVGMENAARFFDGEVLKLQIREPAFHGNMALLPLPAVDRLLVCKEVMADASFEALRRRFGSERLLAVSEDEIRNYATNGLPIGDIWLAPHLVPERVKSLVLKAGMNVKLLTMRELCEKAGGASRCLVSIADIAESSVHIPPECRLEAVRTVIQNEDGWA